MKMNTTVLNIVLAALVCLVVCFWLGVGALGIFFMAGLTLVLSGLTFSTLSDLGASLVATRKPLDNIAGHLAGKVNRYDPLAVHTR